MSALRPLTPLLLALVSCDPGTGSAAVEHALAALAAGVPEVGGLRLDACRGPRSGIWRQETRGPLTFRFLEGSAAARDLETVAEARLAAYARIRAFVGLAAAPPITVVLSPDRVTAAAHGLGAGVAHADERRVEVLWLEQPGTYERLRPGHELAHVLAAALDGGAAHLPLLDEGLAELLDGSGRDLHRAYADALAAGQELGAPTALDARDLEGRNYGRAGSLAAFLAERFGREALVALYRASVLDAAGRPALTGRPLRTAADLEETLDALTRRVLGRSWTQVRAGWAEALAPALGASPTRPDAATLAELAHLVRAADRALAAGDLLGFRAALDGFYCDVWDEARRLTLAVDRLSGAARIESAIVSAVDLGVRNYREASAQVERRNLEQGGSDVVTYWFEQFPSGWRITWASDWRP